MLSKTDSGTIVTLIILKGMILMVSDIIWSFCCSKVLSDFSYSSPAGMTPGLVMDLMNGRPGPVPMDIAQEAAAMRAMGMTPDQISDTLGDKMQLRQSMPLGGALM
ncbi:hypothetical protein DPMN_038937 [Dreissena polymorpha]|uniref:Uncharacterized protein n=1 Tax=Dreissena polymorpha TaxID=45954 RepID=A0A9D4MHA7_DREPO|nr:hypothetical protein DPMN_038937 [Dreissena polymorpha]